MKLLLPILLFLFFNADDPSLIFIKKIDCKADFFKTDALGNIYIIQGKTITRYNENGAMQKSFSSNLLGAISFADVSDPFRILLFYKDFNQVLFLDNTLSEIRSPVRLDDLKIDQAEIACSSANGGFWIYSSQSKQLVYFDQNLQKIQESISLNNLFDSDQKPAFLLEKSDYLYMYVPEIGILVFDRFGAYFKTINLGKTNSFQVVENKIIYLSEQKLIKYDMKLLTSSSYQIPDSLSGVKDAAIIRDQLILQKDESVSVYSFAK